MSGKQVWQWRNVPIPEPHLAGSVVSLLLHRVRPRPLGGSAAVRVSGAVLVVAGSVLVAWAVRSAGPQDLEQPERLITEGAYRHTRNPMYLGWTLVYLGAGALGDSAWPLILLPGVAATTARVVRLEEARLAAQFRADFELYANRVSRYL